MTKLSPAALAVMDAVVKVYPAFPDEVAAAALRAAAYQVVPESREHYPATFDERHRKVSAFDVRNQLLAIANELGGAGNA
jgi:hypothetical protein